MHYNQIGMEEMLYDYHAPVVQDFYKEPVPQSVANVKVVRGSYVRLKNGDVLRVDETGKERVSKKYQDCKKRDGSFYKKAYIERTPTYISKVWLDGKETYEYFVSDDVAECHCTIIECIYKNDNIIDKQNRYLKVKSKVIKKNKTYLLCNYGNTEICVYNTKINCKCMAEKIKARNLMVGDKVLCKGIGWAMVHKVWSRKIQAYTSNQDRLFFVNEWDILEVADQ